MFINETSIGLLRDKYKDDSEIIVLIQDCLFSFENYHTCIYHLETYKKLFSHNITNSKADFQQNLLSLDQARTLAHNSVISNINILNRLCEQNSLPLFYEGTVSKERPYRVEIADAILAYMEEAIKNRKK